MTVTQIVDGVTFMEGLDMKTSPGYPWNERGERKSDLLKREGGEWKMRPDLKQQVEDIMNYILNPMQERPRCLYTCYLKDELLPRAKVTAGNTRVICAAPLSLTIAWKIIFGNTIAAIHREGPMDYRTGCMVGIDPEVQWREFKINEGEEVVCIDYSKFDGSQQSWVIEGAVSVLGYLAGLEEHQSLRAAEFIWDVEQIVRQEIVHTRGPLPSGCPSTSIIGSFANTMTLHYAISEVTRNMIPSTFYHIRVWTYGDDVLLVVSEHMRKILNPAVLCTYMRDVFGMTATSATDKSLAPEFVPLEGATFLKRGFRRCKSATDLTHPTMDVTTIMQLLCWKRRSATLADNVLMACEFMIHHGRKKFEAFRAMLIEVLQNAEEAEVRDIVWTIPCYNDLHHRWMLKCRGVVEVPFQ